MAANRPNTGTVEAIARRRGARIRGLIALCAGHGQANLQARTVPRLVHEVGVAPMCLCDMPNEREPEPMPREPPAKRVGRTKERLEHTLAVRSRDSWAIVFDVNDHLTTRHS